MAPMQKEPGQKGVNWSNIAVGARVCRTRERLTNVIHRCYYEYGMNLSVRADVSLLIT